LEEPVSYRIIIGKQFIDREVSTVQGATIAAEAVFDHLESQEIFIIDTDTMGVVAKGEMVVWFDWDHVGDTADPMSEPKAKPESKSEPKVEVEELDDLVLETEDEVKEYLAKYLPRNIVIVFEGGAWLQCAYSSLTNHYGWTVHQQLQYAESIFEEGRELLLPGTDKMLPGSAFRPDLAPSEPEESPSIPEPAEVVSWAGRDWESFWEDDPVLILDADGERTVVTFGSLISAYDWDGDEAERTGVALFDYGNPIGLHGGRTVYRLDMEPESPKEPEPEPPPPRRGPVAQMVGMWAEGLSRMFGAPALPALAPATQPDGGDGDRDALAEAVEHFYGDDPVIEYEVEIGSDGETTVTTTTVEVAS
jgi:hypothetical protein